MRIPMRSRAGSVDGSARLEDESRGRKWYYRGIPLRDAASGRRNEIHRAAVGRAGERERIPARES